MSAEQMITLTAPDANPITGTPGDIQTVSFRNKLHYAEQALTTTLSHTVRWPYVIGSGAAASLIVAVNNFHLWHGDTQHSQDVLIDDMAIEYVPGGGGDVSTPILFSGGRPKTLTADLAEARSDTILPSALGFSDVTGIPVGTLLWIKARLHVALDGEYIKVGRSIYEQDGANPGNLLQADIYASGSTTPSSTDTPGPYTYTGAAASDNQLGFSPILLGTFVSDNPVKKTALLLGDSIIHNGGGYGFAQYSCIDSDRASNPIGSIEMSVGGATATHYNSALHAEWKNYVPYCRSMMSMLGTNAEEPFQMETLLEYCKAHGIDKHVLCELTPQCNTTDQFLTEANSQASITSHRSYDGILAQFRYQRLADAIVTWSQGPIDSGATLKGVRGATLETIWYCDGLTTNLCVIQDGTHPSSFTTSPAHGRPNGHSMMEGESRPIFQAVV